MSPKDIYKTELRKFLGEAEISDESVEKSIEIFLGTHETQYVVYSAMNRYGKQEFNQALEEVKALITSLPLREPDTTYINKLIENLKK
jgi:hypothetical protein